jgi:putative DNA primase/helicase
VDSNQTTYEWLCDKGLLATDTRKQREYRMALVANIIGPDNLKVLLCDAPRINRVFPASTILPDTLSTSPEEWLRMAVTDLSRMGASQRGEVLMARYNDALAIHADSDIVHCYNGVVWGLCLIKSYNEQWRRSLLMRKLPIRRTVLSQRSKP